MSNQDSRLNQDAGHKEGNYGNTPPQGQPREGGNPQSHKDMQQDSNEQSANMPKDRQPEKDTEKAAGQP